MDKTAILEQIHRYELRISEYEEENARLRTELERIERARGEYQQKRLYFANHQQRDMMRAQQARNIARIRAADSFSDTLTNLNNNMSYRAEDSFRGIELSLNKGRQKKEDAIQSNNSAIRNLRNEISYLRTRLLSLS